MVKINKIEKIVGNCIMIIGLITSGFILWVAGESGIFSSGFLILGSLTIFGLNNCGVKVNEVSKR